ncbi:MAG: divergent polysaccharide deacetylase family protein [Candidatus Omnitrophota bacterium]
MNNFKNLAILLLSVMIIVQSAILLYFLRSQKTGPRPVAARQAASPERVVAAPRPEPVVPAAPLRPQLPVVPAGKIALIIDDWGYNLKNSDFISGNDFSLTLAVLPFREYSGRIAEMAQQSGKDVIIHMPMEPHHKEQYGLEENTLLTTMPSSQVTRLLNEAFADVPHAKGVSNHMGSRATEDARLMRAVMGYLKNKGMFFVDSLVTSKSVCRATAASIGENFASRDVFIDNEDDPDAIRQQMVSLARVAKKKGLAVGIGHDRPQTIAVLKEMIPALREQGYEFVNISEIVRHEARQKKGR